MMSRLRFIVPIVVIVALIGLLGYGLTRNPHYIPSALLGRDAPEFQLPRLSQPENLLSNKQLAGQVSVVNVWASWCVSCRVEHKWIEQLRRQTGVAIYGIDYKDTRKQAHRWLRTFGNPFKAIGFDEKGRTSINWGVAGVPETFILDSHGIIRYKQPGPINRQLLESRIIPLIRKLQSETAS